MGSSRRRRQRKAMRADKRRQQWEDEASEQASDYATPPPERELDAATTLLSLHGGQIASQDHEDRMGDQVRTEVVSPQHDSSEAGVDGNALASSGDATPPMPLFLEQDDPATFQQTVRDLCGSRSRSGDRMLDTATDGARNAGMTAGTVDDWPSLPTHAMSMMPPAEGWQVRRSQRRSSQRVGTGQNRCETGNAAPPPAAAAIDQGHVTRQRAAAIKPPRNFQVSSCRDVTARLEDSKVSPAVRVNPTISAYASGSGQSTSQARLMPPTQNMPTDLRQGAVPKAGDYVTPHVGLPGNSQPLASNRRPESPSSDMSTAMQGMLQAMSTAVTDNQRQTREMMANMARDMASERRTLMGALTGVLQGVMDGKQAPTEDSDVDRKVLAAIRRQEGRCPPPKSMPPYQPNATHPRNASSGYARTHTTGEPNRSYTRSFDTRQEWVRQDRRNEGYGHGNRNPTEAGSYNTQAGWPRQNHHDERWDNGDVNLASLRDGGPRTRWDAAGVPPSRREEPMYSREEQAPAPNPILQQGYGSSIPRRTHQGAMIVGAHLGSFIGTSQADTGRVPNLGLEGDHRVSPPRRANQGAPWDNAGPNQRHTTTLPPPDRPRPPLAEDDSYSDRESASLLGTNRTGRATSGNVKLPPFTGQEPWHVWYNHFTDVADELLPRIQGDAGEFVYAQLPREVWRSYPRLTAELDARYRKVETTKTYSAWFSHRDQKPGEAAEEYAAELKRLYDKAYPQRAAQTRREDLLRRFLDGLSDEQARFQVEFVKDPGDIDATVYEVVAF